MKGNSWLFQQVNPRKTLGQLVFDRAVLRTLVWIAVLLAFCF